MAAMLPWLEFLLCVALIGAAGPALARYGDVIAELTGLSRSWIGLVLIATATSLPELFTGMSAVTVADVPNIAIGDALGSCVFNLVMLVLLDELSRGKPLYRRIDQGHILTAGFGVILIGLVGAFILLSQRDLAFEVRHISIYTLFIIAIYLVAMRAAFVYERRAHPSPGSAAAKGGITMRQAALRYAAAAGVVVVAGVWLPFVGEAIAESTGLKATFVGTLLIAGATSVPELVVTIAALRLGAVDIAIGNLLGSNLFDILIVALDDFAYRKGPLLRAVSPAHAVTAFAGVIMSGIFVVAMLYKPQSRLGGALGWTSLSLLVVYLFSAYALYLLGQ
jgi:cation:H+ antiporter